MISMFKMGKHKSVGYLAAILGGLSFGAIPVVSATLRDLGVSSVEQSLLRLFVGSLVGVCIIITFRYKMSQEYLEFYAFSTLRLFSSRIENNRTFPSFHFIFSTSSLGTVTK